MIDSGRSCVKTRVIFEYNDLKHDLFGSLLEVTLVREKKEIGIESCYQCQKQMQDSIKEREGVRKREKAM